MSGPSLALGIHPGRGLGSLAGPGRFPPAVSPTYPLSSGQRPRCMHSPLADFLCFPPVGVDVSSRFIAD